MLFLSVIQAAIMFSISRFALTRNSLDIVEFSHFSDILIPFSYYQLFSHYFHPSCSYYFFLFSGFLTLFLHYTLVWVSHYCLIMFIASYGIDNLCGYTNCFNGLARHLHSNITLPGYFYFILFYLCYIILVSLFIYMPE